MKNKRYMSLLSLAVCAALVGCAGTNENTYDDDVVYDTPTVDYVERLDVSDSSHQDSFLNQLAMNYRSYSIYNARNSGYPDIAELFAHKAIMAFAGETPFPENLDSWSVSDDSERFEIYTAYNKLMDALKEDISETNPQLAAEAQA